MNARSSCRGLVPARRAMTRDLQRRRQVLLHQQNDAVAVDVVVGVGDKGMAWKHGLPVIDMKGCTKAAADALPTAPRFESADGGAVLADPELAGLKRHLSLACGVEA